MVLKQKQQNKSLAKFLAHNKTENKMISQVGQIGFKPFNSINRNRESSPVKPNENRMLELLNSVQQQVSVEHIKEEPKEINLPQAMQPESSTNSNNANVFFSLKKMLVNKENSNNMNHNVVKSDFQNGSNNNKDDARKMSNQYEIQDPLQMERNNVGIIGNLALSNMNHDIEDLQPNFSALH